MDVIQTPNKYVCIYAYYEKNEEYKSNLDFFLKHGILDNVDYYIVINGNSTVEIPENIENITVLKRENNGFDFGAWSYALPKLEKDYDYYVFINSSVIGPYITDEDKKNNRNWLQKFLELFNTPDVRLVGTTINMYTDINNKLLTHVQSMFFVLDKLGIDYLKSNYFFEEEIINNMKQINEIVFNMEIGMSQQILNNGWNINCIVPNYRDQDYRILTKNINIPDHITDVVYKNRFFGRSLQPEEVVFYKKYRMEL